jgi:hypothetical protein
MPRAPRLAEQFDQPEAEAAPVDVVEVVIVPPAEIELTELRMMNAALTARVAELEPKPEEGWPALKVVAFNTSMVGETLRDWCVKGLVTARRDGAHWFVDESSVVARQRRLGHQK